MRQCPVASRPESRGVLPPLSVQLRTETRPAHVAVEALFALEARLHNWITYASLLVMLRDFYGPAEDALARLRGWDQLRPSIDLHGRRRAGLIDDDLGVLAAAGVPALDAPDPVTCELGSLADGLGCLYVLEGSALGGRIVARRARLALGTGLPVAFFTGAGRSDLRATWSSLVRTIDTFGAQQPIGVRSAVVDAAQVAFVSLGDRLAFQGAMQ